MLVGSKELLVVHLTEIPSDCASYDMPVRKDRSATLRRTHKIMGIRQAKSLATYPRIKRAFSMTSCSTLKYVFSPWKYRY